MIKIINNIKSAYFLKEVFSFLYEKQKLTIIKYNKKLQKIAGIEIQNYKIKSEKYKIGEKNGKGKEYNLNTDILIFEGEYLNGIKNGKAKEFHYNGILKYEGEYSKGKRNGKAKEYYQNGK